MAAIRRFLLRLASFFRSNHAEVELAREIDSHLQLLEDNFLAQGMSPEEARSAARRAFGGVEQAKEHQRDARSFRWLDGWWLDFKLGTRLLIKYPGLTLVGGLAIAFAIAIGACVFELVTQLANPKLPLEDGDRIVGIRNWDAAAASVEPQALHDFAAWREALDSVEDLGAFRTIERNLIVGEKRTEPVAVAEISASAFQVARVRPLLGRPLIQADEQAGAPAVVVIGYDVWRTRFGGDPKVIGRTVRLGSSQRTVVGVMPEGFAFPVAHSLWIPFRLNALDYERRQGPSIQVFGRIVSGVPIDQARTEISALGARAAAAFPDTHKHLRPEVVPYAESIFRIRFDSTVRATLYSVNLLFVMFLALTCANVATLVFARTATRESEIVVRNALGASRGRIVMQLFVEALVLGGVAALAGLAAADFGLKWGMSLLGGGLVEFAVRGGLLPFWLHASLSPQTVLYAGALTVFGAIISGAVPALKVTSGMQTRLREAAVGGAGLRFGRIWTVLIVIQVAATVAFPATAYFVQRDAVQVRSLDVGFPEKEYLSVQLEMDDEASKAELLARFRTTSQELERRLAAEPGVAGVTFANLLPRMDHPQRRIEVDSGMVAPPESALGHNVSNASVDVDFFTVLGAPILSGRGFNSGDLESGREVVIVNQSFVRQILGGANPVGRRVRYLDLKDPDAVRSEVEPGPWHEIVGVVKDLGMTDGSFPGEGAGLYHPMAPGGVYPVYMAVHVGADPQSFAPRLRGVATGVDPTLRLYKLQPLDEIASLTLQTIAFWFRVVVLASAVALLLSLAGIYSIMSFTVSRRTREIGIRSALGADPRRIIASIFSRALVQFGLGVVAGGGLVLALMHLASGGELSAKAAGLFLAYMALMLGVCTLACIVPTRKALRIQPTEAMRADR